MDSKRASSHATCVYVTFPFSLWKTTCPLSRQCQFPPLIIQTCCTIYKPQLLNYRCPSFLAFSLHWVNNNLWPMFIQVHIKSNNLCKICNHWTGKFNDPKPFRPTHLTKLQKFSYNTSNIENSENLSVFTNIP